MVHTRVLDSGRGVLGVGGSCARAWGVCVGADVSGRQPVVRWCAAWGGAVVWQHQMSDHKTAVVKSHVRKWFVHLPATPSRGARRFRNITPLVDWAGLVVQLKGICRRQALAESVISCAWDARDARRSCFDMGPVQGPDARGRSNACRARAPFFPIQCLTVFERWW